MGVTGEDAQSFGTKLLDPLGIFTPTDSASDIAMENAAIYNDLINAGVLSETRRAEGDRIFRTVAAQLDQENEGLNLLRQTSQSLQDLAARRGAQGTIAEQESQRLRGAALRDIAGQASLQSQGTFNPAVARAAINAQGTTGADIDRQTRIAAQKERLAALQQLAQLGAVQAQERLNREKLLEQLRQNITQRQLATFSTLAGNGQQAAFLEANSGLDAAIGGLLSGAGSLFGGGGSSSGGGK